MDQQMIERLVKKGWSEQEILKASKIMKEAGVSKQGVWQSVLYWSFLFLAIVANLIVAIVIFPLLMISKSDMLYVLILLLGIVFGYMFSVILKDIEELQPEHHIIAGLFIPAIALIGVVYMAGVANRASVELGIQAHQSPLFAGLTYASAFMAAFFFSKYFTIVPTSRDVNR